MAPKKSGKIIRLEPEGTELLDAYPQMAQRFKDVGWFDFFTTFKGHDEQLADWKLEENDGGKRST
jgi:hypothetical protein